MPYEYLAILELTSNQSSGSKSDYSPKECKKYNCRLLPRPTQVKLISLYELKFLKTPGEETNFLYRIIANSVCRHPDSP